MKMQMQAACLPASAPSMLTDPSQTDRNGTVPARTEPPWVRKQ